MIPFIRSTPVTDPDAVHQMIVHGAKWTLAGSLGCFAILAVISALGVTPADLDAYVAYLLGALIYWLFRLAIVVPLLWTLIPVIKRLVQRGSAGVLIALATGALSAGALGAALSLLAPNARVGLIIIFACFGFAYAALFWTGLHRARPKPPAVKETMR